MYGLDNMPEEQDLATITLDDGRTITYDTLHVHDLRATNGGKEVYLTAGNSFYLAGKLVHRTLDTVDAMIARLQMFKQENTVG